MELRGVTTIPGANPADSGDSASPPGVVVGGADLGPEALELAPQRDGLRLAFAAGGLVAAVALRVVG